MRLHLGRVLLLLAVIGITAHASAQEFRATVTGRVTDPDGLPMPGVTVSATNPRTNEVATAGTSAEGGSTLPFLRPGVYNISAELQGFRKYAQDGVPLEVGQTMALNITLQLGNVAETVTVTGESP